MTNRTKRFDGMSYEQASREGMQLLKDAVHTGDWKNLPEQLIELRNIMRLQGGKF